MPRATRLSTGTIAAVAYSRTDSLSRESDSESDDAASSAIQPISSKISSSGDLEAGSESSEESSSNEDSDDYDDTKAIQTAKKQTALKRKRKLETQEEKALAARGHRLLQSFLALPMEIVSVILAYVDPATIWSLSMTNKLWNGLLWSKRSLAIWVRARLNLTFTHHSKTYQIPPPPNGICEAAWVAITLVPVCMACDKECAPGQEVGNLVNLCEHCEREIMISKVKIKRRLASKRKPEPAPWIFKICTPRRSRLRNYCTAVYLLWEVEELCRTQHKYGKNGPTAKQLAVIQKKRLLDPDLMTQIISDVEGWHAMHSTWLMAEEQRRSIEQQRLLEVLLYKLLRKFMKDSNFNLTFKQTIKYYYDAGIVSLHTDEWIGYAVEEDQPVDDETYARFAEQIRECYLDEHEELSTFSEQWEAGKTVRNLLQPHLEKLRKDHQEVAVWPGLATICSFEPVQLLMQDLEELQDAADFVAERFHCAQDDILEAVSGFSTSLVSTEFNDIKVWFECKTCGVANLSILDAGTHPCLNFRLYDPKTWRDTHINFDICHANDDKLFGIVFNPAGWFRSSRRLSKPLAMMRITLPDLPTTHTAASALRYECGVCKKDKSYVEDHKSSTYRTVLDCFDEFQIDDEREFKSCMKQYNDTTWRYRYPVSIYHLAWKEVSEQSRFQEEEEEEEETVSD